MMETGSKKASIYGKALEAGESQAAQVPSAPSRKIKKAPALSEKKEMPQTTSAHKKTKVVFVVSKFPCYDEAFILREMDALSRQMEIRIFSLRKSTEKMVHDQAAKLLPNTVYVPYFFSRQVLSANFHLLFNRPALYLKALGRLITGNLRCFEFLIKNLAFFPKAVFLARWAMREKITQIHAYWATYPASAALAASEISGIPFSFTGHAHDIYLNTTHLDEKIRRSTFVSTCTSSNKNYLEKLAPGIPEGRIFLNYHGLDLARFETPGKKRNEIFQILSVGTLNPHKGFGYFFEALRFLKEKGITFHATVIGGGPLESELKSQIQMLGLESFVTMTGALKQDQVIPYYKNSDLMVLMAQPEWHWGIPNVLIESLAAATPVITTRFGSVEELVRQGDTGLLVPPKDPAQLAEAMLRLIENETERLRLATQGRELVLQNFDLSKKVGEFANRLSGEGNPAAVSKNVQNAGGSKRRVSRFLSGFLFYFLKLRPVSGTRILCYHKVNDWDSDYLTVSTQKFREQMEWLHSQGYRTATLKDLLEGKTDKKSVIITFDDGYRDNYEQAFPIMKSLGFSGLIFCVSSKMNDGLYLRNEEIKEMREAGFEFGSHTVTHANLKGLGREKQNKEVLGAKKDLEKQWGTECDYFCYPFGCYDEEAVEAVKEAGYLAACSNTPGTNPSGKALLEARGSLFLLKRTEIAAADTLRDFEKKMAGAYDLLHSLLHQLRGRP